MEASSSVNLITFNLVKRYESQNPTIIGYTVYKIKNITVIFLSYT